MIKLVGIYILVCTNLFLYIKKGWKGNGSHAPTAFCWHGAIACIFFYCLYLVITLNSVDSKINSRHLRWRKLICTYLSRHIYTYITPTDLKKPLKESKWKWWSWGTIGLYHTNLFKILIPLYTVSNSGTHWTMHIYYTKKNWYHTKLFFFSVIRRL